MKKEISKPNIVKGIPVPLIRPLPTLYYYGQYPKQDKSSRSYNLFRNSIEYLTNAIKILASEIDDNEFNRVAKLTTDLIDAEKDTIVNKVIQITTQLSDSCVKHNNKIKNNPKYSKENFIHLYKSKVQPLKILLIDNNNEPQRANKFSDIFKNTCYYDVANTILYTEDLIDKINACEFIIFTSAYPITINEDVKNLEPYKKPRLVMADFKKDKKIDQQTIRNGAWLQQQGYEVLYKIFTPLRLFTTIEKIYMKFQFNN